jgi:predicted O-methyltransferase YrrM
VPLSRKNKDPISAMNADMSPLNSLDTLLLKLESRPEALTQHWCIPPQVARWLFLTTLTHNSQRVLEVGTSWGYSTLWLAKAMQKTGGHIDTIEGNATRQQEARHHIQEAQVDSYITCHLGQAITVIATLLEQRKSYDFVFLDATKAEYRQYAEQLAPMMPAGAILIADNTRSHRQSMTPFLEWLDEQTLFDWCEIETPTGQVFARKKSPVT